MNSKYFQPMKIVYQSNKPETPITSGKQNQFSASITSADDINV